jgi:acetyltransferase-like isoleucine patch superfamily enzyme
MRLVALWQRTPIAGWVNTLRFASRGVRLHPSVRVYGGAAGALNLGRGTKIARGCVFNLGAGGEIRLGEKIWAYRDVEFHTEGRIVIGAGASFQRAVLINGNVSIGRGCIFAPGVFASSGKHVYDLKPAWPIRAQEALLAAAPADPDVARYIVDRPVLIDEDCWLGAHVVVAPGVRIGRGAIVGANSVVTRDVEPFAIVVGAPAKPINRRLAWRPQSVLDATSPQARPYLYSGFDVEERGGEVFATVAGQASVALAASSRRVLEVSFRAETKGALAACGRSQSFDAGEQTLRWPDCDGRTSFDQTVLAPLDFTFEKPDGRVRLLRCGFVE